MKIAPQISNITYLMQRMTTIQRRAERDGELEKADMLRVLQDAIYALGLVASAASEMEVEHEKMKKVLRWFVKGDLEEHIDEVRAFIENP